MAWTILRNGLYAELIGMLAAPRGGRITTPFGNSPISAVARADLAEEASKVLGDPNAHAGVTHELSGHTSFSVPDLAQRLGVAYEPISLSAERERLSQLPLLPLQPAMLLSIFSAATGGFLLTDARDFAKARIQASRSTRDSLRIGRHGGVVRCNIGQRILPAVSKGNAR
jgi:NAD(P)H dehydrogenase (quinone)